MKIELPIFKSKLKFHLTILLFGHNVIAKPTFIKQKSKPCVKRVVLIFVEAKKIPPFLRAGLN